MGKEYFLDETGIASATGVAIKPVEGTSTGIVLDVLAGGPDANRVQSGSMHYDELGQFGTAGLLHYWYYALAGNILGTYTSHYCYAYSNDMGDTWTRPNLGLHTFNGNTNNNIVKDSSGAAYFGPVYIDGDAKPFKYGVMSFEGLTLPQRTATIYEATDYTLADGTTVFGPFHVQDHPSLGRTSSGEVVFLTHHRNTTLGTTPDLFFREAGIEIWPDLDTAANVLTYNCTSTFDMTGANNIFSGLHIFPEDQTHGGEFLGDVTDMWGRILLIGAQMFNRETYSSAPTAGDGRWDCALITARGFEDGTIPNGDFYRVGDSAAALLANTGTPKIWDPPESGTKNPAGVWNGGVTGLLHWFSLADSELMFESAEEASQTVMVTPNPHFNATTDDRWRLGKRTWRKDGFTKLTGTGSATTATLPITGMLTVNYAGTLDVACLDSGGSPITGFTTADCDTLSGDSTSSMVTWGGLSMPSTTAALTFTLDGALYSYELTDGVTAIAAADHIDLAYSGTAPFLIERRVV